MRSNGNMDFSHSNTAFSSYQRGVAIMVTTRSFAHSYQSTWNGCIKKCMGNFKLSPKCLEMQNSPSCSTYLCGGDFLCFSSVWGWFSLHLRHSAKNWYMWNQFFMLHLKPRLSPPNTPVTQEITTTQVLKLSRMNYFIAFHDILGLIQSFPYIPLYDISHSLGYLCSELKRILGLSGHTDCKHSGPGALSIFSPKNWLEFLKF